MSSTDLKAELKPGKHCRLCNKIVEAHHYNQDFTCRTCQHECHRAEPIFREIAFLFTSLRSEQNAAIKQIKDELAELKSSLSGRQQKATTTVKGLKDDITELKNEIQALKLVQSKGKGGDGGEGMKKLQQELEKVKLTVETLDQEVASMALAQQEHDAEFEANEETRETVQELEDWQKRLKEAFVSLVGPEVEKSHREKEEEEKERKEMLALKGGLDEFKGIMRQIQQVFTTIPVGGQSSQPQPQLQPKANGTASKGS